jgi:hypothetical protein
MIKKDLACYLTFIFGNLFLLFPISAFSRLNYHLFYKDSSSSLVKISIQPATSLTAPVSFIMNEYLKEKSGGARSMKDVFRFLYNWSKENKRAFTMEEFPLLINKACNIDLTAIYKKWQLPIE